MAIKLINFKENVADLNSSKNWWVERVFLFCIVSVAGVFGCPKTKRWIRVYSLSCALLFLLLGLTFSVCFCYFVVPVA